MCAGKWGSMTESWYDVYSLLSEGRPKISIFLANGTAMRPTHNTDMHIHFSGTQPICVSSGILSHP